MDVKSLRESVGHYRTLIEWLTSICTEEDINAKPLKNGMVEIGRMEKVLGIAETLGLGKLPLEQLAVVFGAEPGLSFFENFGNGITSSGEFHDIVKDVHRFTGRLLRENKTHTSRGDEVTESERLYRYFNYFRLFRDKAVKAFARAQGMPVPDLTGTASPLHQLLAQLEAKHARLETVPCRGARSDEPPKLRIVYQDQASGDSEQSPSLEAPSSADPSPAAASRD